MASPPTLLMHSTASADVLIGADGIRSTVRSMIDLTAPPPRLHRPDRLGRMDNVAPSVASTNTNYHMIFDKKAFFGYQVADDGQYRLVRQSAAPRPADAGPGSSRVSPEHWLHLLRDAFAARPDTGCSHIIARDLTGRPDDHRRTGDHANRTRVEPWPHRPRRRCGACSVTELRSGRLDGDRECRRTRSLPA